MQHFIVPEWPDHSPVCSGKGTAVTAIGRDVLTSAQDLAIWGRHYGHGPGRDIVASAGELLFLRGLFLLSIMSPEMVWAISHPTVCGGTRELKNEYLIFFLTDASTVTTCSKQEK